MSTDARIIQVTDFMKESWSVVRSIYQECGAPNGDTHEGLMQWVATFSDADKRYILIEIAEELGTEKFDRVDKAVASLKAEYLPA